MVLRVAHPTVDLSHLWCDAFLYAMDFSSPETAASHFATQVHAHCERYFASATQSRVSFSQLRPVRYSLQNPDHTNEDGYSPPAPKQYR